MTVWSFSSSWHTALNLLIKVSRGSEWSWVEFIGHGRLQAGWNVQYLHWDTNEIPRGTPQGRHTENGWTNLFHLREVCCSRYLNNSSLPSSVLSSSFHFLDTLLSGTQDFKELANAVCTGTNSLQILSCSLTFQSFKFKNAKSQCK